MATKSKFFVNIFEVRFKFLIFVLLFFYIIGVFYVALSTFRTDDPMPDVKVVTIKMHKRFNELLSTIRIGLHIRNFSHFDFTTNNFTVNALVWFEFNKNEIQLKTIDQFSFENSKIIFKTQPYIMLHGNKMTIKYDVIFEVKTDVNFYRFPLEDHRLSIVLANNFVTPDEMYFDNNENGLSFNIAENLFTSNWKNHATRSVAGYSSLPYDNFDGRARRRYEKVRITRNRYCFFDT